MTLPQRLFFILRPPKNRDNIDMVGQPVMAGKPEQVGQASLPALVVQSIEVIVVVPNRFEPTPSSRPIAATQGPAQFS